MTDTVLEKVAEAYDPGGFIYKLRVDRVFDDELAQDFLADVKQLSIDVSEPISQELVALVWHLPVMLQYQLDRAKLEDPIRASKIDYVHSSVVSFFERSIGLP